MNLHVDSKNKSDSLLDLHIDFTNNPSNIMNSHLDFVGSESEFVMNSNNRMNITKK